MGTSLVTGASRGIGLELCTRLHRRGDTVIAACRSASAALRALGCRVVEGVDVTDADSVQRLAATLEGERIDLLVNNAGVLVRDTLDDLDVEGIRRQFEVNALGPLRVTRALLPNLGSGSKVVIITSRMGSIGDGPSGAFYGYRMSKAAVNMAGASLARDLASRGITVLLLHPGMVATDMTGAQGIPVGESAQNILARIAALGPEASGGFYHANGELLPW
jgi:NAD(P)-dependent dehydrogenase (short-subunit alcohol dehydrogenase family)